MHHDQLILKYLSGAISEAEKQRLDAWVRASDENKKAFDDFAAIWNLTKDDGIAKDFETQREWIKFESAFNNDNTRGARVRRFNPLDLGLKVAASIAFLALFSFVLYLTFFNASTTLIETSTTMNRVALPDGSAVWVNQQSRLSYSSNFNKGNRTVELDGEAFFEVKKDSERPFIVRLNDAEIKVLGTSFNVSAYQSGDAIKVYVATGIVNFSNADERTAGVMLSAGETGTLMLSTNVISTSSEENTNALAWREKKLIFKKTSLANVVKDLSKYFNIDIQVKDQSILQCRFTGSFDKPGLEEIIEALSVSLDLTITRLGDAYVIDGNGC